MAENTPALLQLRDVRKYFPYRGILPFRPVQGVVRAVDGVSLDINPHETLGLVGESGCGKTTTAKLILRLERPTSGDIAFQGRDVHRLRGQHLRQYRASVQAVFQDPWSSLNPRMRAENIVAEPIVVNQRYSRKEVRQRVADLLHIVGLDPSLAGNFPHEFSGGMRQRLAVARAMALHPALIVLDEPVSALDVSIRAQIMNLLKDLQETYGMAYLLIAHNLATVRYLSHQVAVMYLGEIVESGPTEELFTNPLHPYTKALISAAVPVRPGEQREDMLLSGDVPSPVNPPPGCRFHTRCPFTFDRCPREVPQLRQLTLGHKVACHLD
jgi:oligopeptide transport system ATP-binding protein